MQAEEDSDEEWSRIADEAGVLEAQYIAARSSAAPASSPAPAAASSTTAASIPTVSAPTHVSTALPPAHVPPSSAPAPVADADPYALALRERDAQIEQLRSERAGELANFRNKIRALQNQLLAARSSASSAASSALAPRVTQLETEKVRLGRELTAAQRDAVAAQERLAFAEHELQQARDRERQHLAALRGGGQKEKPNAGVNMRDLGMLEAGALTQGGAMGTQVGEVVEATQVATQGTRRPATAQGFEMNRSSVRAPVRRRRRPSSAAARLGGGGGGSAGRSSRAEGVGETQDGSARAQRSGRKRGVESADDGYGDRTEPAAPPVAPAIPSIHDQQHGWGVRLSEATWEHGALRARVFGGGVGDRLIEIATTLKEKPLRQAIMRAMARDSDWNALLEPVASLQDAGRAATLVSAECLAELLTFSQDCRHIVGRGETSVLRRTNESLTKASRDRDARVAGVCLQVLVGGACGIGEVGAEASTVARREVRCDAALDWIRGVGEDDDAAVVEARRGAVALVEAVTGLALEDEEPDSGESQESEDGGWRAAEWVFVEKGYLCISDAITNGEADDYTLKHGCAMLVRAGVSAPYVVAECGGSEAAANALMHAVRRGDDHVATGVAIACAQTLCMTIAGSEGDAGIARHTMNVLLGVIAGIKGDGIVAKECRRVAGALASMRHRIRRGEG